MNDTFRLFVDRFNRHAPPAPATPEDVAYMEHELSTVLPLSYRRFITTYGEVYTPGLLDLIVEKQVDLPDVQNISSPREAVEATLAYWSGDAPKDLVAFANDCMGNVFGFLRLEPGLTAPADAPVYMFDHDFAELRPVASSFESFIAAYVAIPSGPA